MTAPRRVRKPAPEQAPLPLTIQEGVHLNLPDSLYFEAPALGSSDFHILSTDPASWWYASPHNPERKDKRRKSRALAFGSALHALVLEGEHAYQRRFVVEPDADSNAYARTREAMVKLLEDNGVRVPTKQSFDPEWLNVKIREKGLAHRVWKTAYADYEAAERRGFTMITSDEDRRLRRMAWHIDRHSDLGPNLKKGLSEVSVFWRDPARPEILLRARFDKLLPGFVIDLKTFSNTRDESPEEATFSSITNEGYDLQAEHYRDAWHRLHDFVAEGRIYAWETKGEDHGRALVLKKERDALAEIVAVMAWRWVWIFYQVQNDDAGRERAPIVVPWWTWPDGELFTNARAVIDRALDNYQTWMNRAGASQPWAEVHPIRQLPVEKLRRLTFKRTAQ